MTGGDTLTPACARHVGEQVVDLTLAKNLQVRIEPVQKPDGARVQLDAEHFHPVLRQGFVPERTSHFFHAVLTRKEARAFVQFFAGPNSLPPPARVLLATNPLLIEAKYFACHQACYFDVCVVGNTREGERNLVGN